MGQRWVFCKRWRSSCSNCIILKFMKRIYEKKCQAMSFRDSCYVNDDVIPSNSRIDTCNMLLLFLCTRLILYWLLRLKNRIKLQPESSYFYIWWSEHSLRCDATTQCNIQGKYNLFTCSRLSPMIVTPTRIIQLK